MSAAPVRCVVLGAAGQLGAELLRSFAWSGEACGLTRADIDLRDAKRLKETLTALRPTHVLNASAYNFVDRAEDEPDAAFAINAEAVATMADAAERLGATFAHFSTDYVFDGRQRRPYREDDAPNPLGAYAASKLAGERLALERCRRTFVVRVSGLFGLAPTLGKTNFVETMLGAARAGHALRVVNDQVLAPTYTADAAPKVWRILERGTPGIWHVTNAGETSFYDFAREIFARAALAPLLTPVTSAQYAARAPRPAYSVLARTRLAALGEDDVQPWQDALGDYLARRAVTAPSGSGSRSGGSRR